MENTKLEVVEKLNKIYTLQNARYIILSNLLLILLCELFNYINK